jgi:hypothetical protein
MITYTLTFSQSCIPKVTIYIFCIIIIIIMPTSLPKREEASGTPRVSVCVQTTESLLEILRAREGVLAQEQLKTMPTKAGSSVSSKTPQRDKTLRFSLKQWHKEIVNTCSRSKFSFKTPLLSLYLQNVVEMGRKRSEGVESVVPLRFTCTETSTSSGSGCCSSSQINNGVMNRVDSFVRDANRFVHVGEGEGVDQNNNNSENVEEQEVIKIIFR